MTVVHILLLIFIGISMAAGLASVGVQWHRRRRLPVELRGDWWTQFERDFRAYARTHPAGSRDSRRRPRRRETP